LEARPDAGHGAVVDDELGACDGGGREALAVTVPLPVIEPDKESCGLQLREIAVVF
jgi:hypothetical protein